MNSEFTSMTNVDGRIAPTAEASIPVLDRGFLYGDSVYEVFRTYSGVPLFMQEHFDRIENSARLARMQISQTRDQLTEEIRRTVRAAGATPERDLYVRYAITRGEGPIDLYPDPALTTRFVIIVREAPRWDPELYRVGLRVAVPAVRRNPVDALNPNIKSGNYLNNVLAVSEARERGADDSLILNHEGLVTEASNSNVFFVAGDRLITPSQGSGNLAGLTKQAVHASCRANGLATEELDLHVDDLARMTECFLTSSTREVMPVRSLLLEDGSEQVFPDGGGELTRRAMRYYREYVADYVAAHADQGLV